MTNFIISTDSSADLLKSFLKEKNIYSIIMKRILNNEEIGEHYESEKDFDVFYETLKEGDLPTTSAINPFEMQGHFKNILKKEKQGDIIHISLSSGLSATYDNARKAAAEVNKTLTHRKVYVVDSLIATHGMAFIIEELIKLRDAGVSTKNAIKQIQKLRDHLQGWVIMNDLFHLKRGGRISGASAVIGSILNIKPIITINRIGKLAIENKKKGDKNAIDYLLGKMHDLGERTNKKFPTSTVYLIRTSKSKLYSELKKAVSARYPLIRIEERVVGPIVGTHLGCNGAFIIFDGAERLDVK